LSEKVKNLSEDERVSLALAPIAIFYLVFHGPLSYREIKEKHLVRALEYGLKGTSESMTYLIEFLRINCNRLFQQFVSDPLHTDESGQKKALRHIIKTAHRLSEKNFPISEYLDLLFSYTDFLAQGTLYTKDGPQLSDTQLSLLQQQSRAVKELIQQ